MTLKDELAKVLAIEDQAACALAFNEFCRTHGQDLPLPGVDTQFDKAMWAASQFFSLSSKDESILNRVTGKLLPPPVEVVSGAVLKLKDLLGSSKQAAIATWQEMLSAMDWQPMVPAGALRGVGSPMVSLGTFEKQLADANLQLNLAWVADQDRLRILLQAKNSQQEALPSVELRLLEADKGLVFSSLTNQDGSIVASNLQLGPGKYQIQIAWSNQTVETPYFVI